MARASACSGALNSARARLTGRRKQVSPASRLRFPATPWRRQATLRPRSGHACHALSIRHPWACHVQSSHVDRTQAAPRAAHTRSFFTMVTGFAEAISPAAARSRRSPWRLCPRGAPRWRCFSPSGAAAAHVERRRSGARARCIVATSSGVACSRRLCEWRRHL